MCTVTYIPKINEGSFILTSNRDERFSRGTIPPEIYIYEECKLMFPRDLKASGSWIAMSDKGRINCLLNGGFIAHQKQRYHTKSRGTVLIEFTKSSMSIHNFFKQKYLKNVEPFTIVNMEHDNGKIQNLTEFIWDGNDKHFRQLEINIPYIWSSVTLYNEEHRKTRKEWFERFYNLHRENITKENVFDFHSGTHTNDNSINIIMQREGHLKTVSITQILEANNKVKMIYRDLLNNSCIENEL